MANKMKPKPMSKAVFKAIMLGYKVCDLFWNLKRDLKRIPLRKGMTVVDYGCALGRYTLPIAKLVGSKGRVFAVDIQPLAISTIREKAASKGLTNLEAILVNSYNTGIQSSSIDLVLLIATLPLIKEYKLLFHEIHRIIKPGGIIFMKHLCMRISMSRTKEIVESTGFFTMIECRGGIEPEMLFAPRIK